MEIILLLSGFDTSRATYNEDAGRIVATDQTSAEAVGADPATVSSTLTAFPSQSTSLKINNFSNTSYNKQVAQAVESIYPTFSQMFIFDTVGNMILNKQAFGDDIAAYKSFSNTKLFK